MYQLLSCCLRCRVRAYVCTPKRITAACWCLCYCCCHCNDSCSLWCCAKRQQQQVQANSQHSVRQQNAPRRSGDDAMRCDAARRVTLGLSRFTSASAIRFILNFFADRLDAFFYFTCIYTNIHAYICKRVCVIASRYVYISVCVRRLRSASLLVCMRSCSVRIGLGLESNRFGVVVVVAWALIIHFRCDFVFFSFSFAFRFGVSDFLLLRPLHCTAPPCHAAQRTITLRASFYENSVCIFPLSIYC